MTLLEDLLPDENFGVKLLEIAGRRLNVYIEASKSNFLTVASVGQHLLQYLDNLVRFLVSYPFILVYILYFSIKG